VTGNPISFNTNIAQVVVPQRKTVNVVDEEVQGNLYVHESYSAGLESSKGGSLTGFPPSNTISPSIRIAAARNVSPKMSSQNYCQFGMNELEAASMHQMASGDGELESVCDMAAETAGVDSREVGDFCVFTSKEPITILARKSAVVPMFSAPLSKAGVVLLYRDSYNPRRPYRTVKFKNETAFSLGKGKTYIYNEGVFSGECVLEATKPTENRMLPHCLENGVKVAREVKPVQTTRQAIAISEGVSVVEDVSTSITTYTVENKKDEEFKMAVEHINVLQSHPNNNVDFEGVVIEEKEKLTTGGDGYRIYFKLAPKQTIKIIVNETSLTKQTMVLGHFGLVKHIIIDTNNPLSKDKQIQSCIKVQEKIEALVAEVADAEGRREELGEQAERVRKNITASKDVANSVTVKEWVMDLDASEKEIRSLDKTTIPALNTKLREAQAKLAEEIKKISVTWKAKD
jgi:hypothetical protein